ncbi:MAG: hypothetical protein Q4D98_08555 [Planctomycetia bacterium]|nr:hypothetical protein [Planctomycetia bacterium]
MAFDFSVVRETRLSHLTERKAVQLLKSCRELAPWLLRKEVYAIADLPFHRPRIPNDIGCCWILLVQKNWEKESVLRPAMILPLEWKSNEKEHDKRLPDGLLALAQSISEQLNASHWTLHSAEGMKIPDLSSMDIGQWSSAWVPLFSGLQLALLDLQPRPDVFATGAWDDNLKPIAGLREKIEVAREWSGKHFFFPQADDAETSQTEQLFRKEMRLHKMRITTKLHLAVRDHLTCLAAAPKKRVYPDAAAWERFDHYYRLLPTIQERRAFYQSHYMRPVMKKLLRENPQIKKWQNRTFVCWLSERIDLTELAVRLFHPSRMILFATEGMLEKEREDLLKNLQKEGLCLIPEIFTSPKNLPIPDLRRLVLGTLQKTIRQEEPLLFDLTLRSVPISLVFSHCRYPQSLFLFWNRAMLDHLPYPSTIRMELLEPWDV